MQLAKLSQSMIVLYANSEDPKEIGSSKRLASQHQNGQPIVRMEPRVPGYYPEETAPLCRPYDVLHVLKIWVECGYDL